MFKRPTQLAGETVVIALALIWIGFLASRPVHISVLVPPEEIEPRAAQALSGVRGQTFIAPSDRLSRIDLELDTHIPPGEWVRVKFELAQGVAPRNTLASAIAVFDRSRDGWPVQLSFDPRLTSSGEDLYLRLESILSSPRAELYYRYDRDGYYPQGDFLDLDRPTTLGQDLIVTVFHAPSLPKPLAWIEAIADRADQAAARAALVSPWIPALVGVLALGAALAALAASMNLLIRVWAWRPTPLTIPALVAVVCASTAAIIAWGEFPVGKLALNLT
ncbi:MAG: hypothetical protein OXG46_06240 [Chloroflexi bacterium]|nr:hypothetical protein [Chloroflexota bacterium]